MRASELVRAVKRDAKDICLITRLCEDPASVGKLLWPELQALVCRCAVREEEVGEAMWRFRRRSGAVPKGMDDVYDQSCTNRCEAVTLYRKWAK